MPTDEIAGLLCPLLQYEGPRLVDMALPRLAGLRASCGWPKTQCSLHFKSRTQVPQNLSSMAASKAPSLLEYARYHGLAIAHRTRDLLSGVSAASERDVTTKDDDHLPAFTLPISKDFYHEPQLQLNAAGRILLSHSIRPPDLPGWDRFLPDHHRVQTLKFEEALIPGDCDQNTWDFVVRQNLDLARQAVQPEIMVEDSDAALGFPPELLQLAEQWDAEIAQERLQTKKEVLGRLWNTLQDDFLPELYESIVAESLQLKRVRRAHSVCC